MTNGEAIKTIETAIAEVEWEYPMEYAAAFEKAIAALKNDAVPVVHGHWIHTGKTNVFGGHQHECSVCGYSLMVSAMCDNENFCCSCGAKMDEVSE